jgi:hypothetical protein
LFARNTTRPLLAVLLVACCLCRTLVLTGVNDFPTYNLSQLLKGQIDGRGFPDETWLVGWFFSVALVAMAGLGQFPYSDGV